MDAPIHTKAQMEFINEETSSGIRGINQSERNTVAPRQFLQETADSGTPSLFVDGTSVVDTTIG